VSRRSTQYPEIEDAVVDEATAEEPEQRPDPVTTDPVEAETAPAAESVPEPDEEPPQPEFLPRYTRPSEAAKKHVLDRIMAGSVTIEGGIWDDAGASWNGVRVVPVAWIIGVATEALPEPNAYSAEVRSGGRATVWTTCGNCGGTYPDEGSFGSEFKVAVKNGVPKRTLKATFRSEGVTHVCGQVILPLQAAEGQTEAFTAASEDEAADAELTDEAREKLADDVVGLLDRIERDELIDSDAVGIPPEEEIRAWTSGDLQLAYEWAWSVVHGETDQPPVPAVLVRATAPEPVASETRPAEDEIACSHQGRGLPDCTVCHPVPADTPLGEIIDGGAGTGDPDGDLLP
jgi:hypothetical protein